MLGFFLNGRLLQDNSIVLLGDIGEGSSALYCLTDRELCCSAEAGGDRGLWRSPDGIVHGNVGFYSTKGFSSIHLSRRSRTMGPIGLYRCVIPSSSDRDRASSTLHIGIYSSNAEGKFHSLSS